MKNDRKEDKNTQKSAKQTIRITLTPQAVEAILQGLEVEVKIDEMLSIKLNYDDKRKKN